MAEIKCPIEINGQMWQVDSYDDQVANLVHTFGTKHTVARNGTDELATYINRIIRAYEAGAIE